MGLKSKKRLLLGILVLLLSVLGVSFAYFGNSNFNVGQEINVNLGTLADDTIMYLVGPSLAMDINTTTLGVDATDMLESSTWAEIRFKKGNQTATSTARYYVYLDLNENTFDYTQNGSCSNNLYDNETDCETNSGTWSYPAEIILEVTNPEGVKVTTPTLDSLKYVTVTDKDNNTISGYDITNYNGVVKIADETITASDLTAIVKRWHVKITFVNYAENQKGNKGKELNGFLSISGSEYNRDYAILSGANQTYTDDDVVIRSAGPYDNFSELKIDNVTVNPSNYEIQKGSTIITLKKDYLNSLTNGTHSIKFIFDYGISETNILKTLLFSNYIMNTVYTGVDGENGLYKHDGIGDYEIAGEMVAASEVEAKFLDGTYENSYRYSGSNEVVNNYVCFGYPDTFDVNDCMDSSKNAEYLYRVIGVFDENVGDTGESAYQVKLIKANWLTTDYIGGGQGTNAWYWQGSNSTTRNNTWGDSTLNTDALNTRYLNKLNETTTKWGNLIEEHIWKVGGNTDGNIRTIIANIFANEMSPIFNGSYQPTDERLFSTPTKIGLMYVSDYGYATNPEYWKTMITSNSVIDYNNNCLIGRNIPNGKEWTITRNSSLNDGMAYAIMTNGYLDSEWTNGAYGVRPTFYLKNNIAYISGTGTITDPYIIGM